MIFNNEDRLLKKLVEKNSNPIKKYHIEFLIFSLKILQLISRLKKEKYFISIFGNHNLSNLSGAQWISQLMGVNISDFYEAIPTFKGASKRLECQAKGRNLSSFNDFAHAPSKVKVDRGRSL